MLLVKKAETIKELNLVFKALPALNPTDGIHVYGYWKGNKCVGASWLNKEFPHYLNMEYYDKSALIVKAIAESFKELFKIRPRLQAKIDISNYKSNKMTKQLGFYKLYTENGYNIVEIAPETWKFKDKYPVVER